MSDEYLIAQGVAANGQLTWPSAKVSSKNLSYCHFLKQLLFIVHNINSGFNLLSSKTRSRRESVTKGFIPATVALSTACQVGIPLRIVQSVSFIVTPVGVPLVACFFLVLIHLNAIVQCFLLFLLLMHPVQYKNQSRVQQEYLPYEFK